MILSGIIPESMLELLQKAAEKVHSVDYVKIIAHYDGDGTSSAIILSKALLREHKKFHISYIKDLSPESVKARIDEDPDYLTIIVDAGSDQSSLVSSNDKIIILDHHFHSPGEFKGIHVNSRDHGVDGTKEACGATMAYLFSLTLNEKNTDLFPFFLSGAIADKQDIGGYVGLNRVLIEKLGKGFRKIRTINLAGEDLLEALSYSVDPFFGTLSGNREFSKTFLTAINIDHSKSPKDLTEDEKQKLEEKLAIELLKQGISSDALKYLETDMWVFDDLGLTSKEIAGIVDGNSKISQNGTVIQYFLGDEAVRKVCMDNWRRFKSKLIEFAKQASREMFSLTNVQYFYAPDSEMAGSIAGLLMLYYAKQDLPVIGFNSGESPITKVSARGTAKMVRNGLNLSVVVRDACASVGGHGGGHDIAAGGSIPKGKESAFLSKANSMIDEQIGNFGCE